jgi:copper(I)-binding protein
MFALLAVVFLACLPVESYAHEIRAGELVIIHPWMPEPLRGAKAGVVYLKIQNTGQSTMNCSAPKARSRKV